MSEFTDAGRPAEGVLIEARLSARFGAFLLRCVKTLSIFAPKKSKKTAPQHSNAVGDRESHQSLEDDCIQRTSAARTQLWE